MVKILVPVDFSKEALDALQFAVGLTSAKSAKIEVIHVVEYPVGAAMDPVGMAVPSPYDPEFVDLLKENAEKRMNEFLGQFKSAISYTIEVGNPFFEITEKLSKIDADLVVMGTKGATGFKEFFIGSNAEKVVRKASCPVITLAQPTRCEDIQDIVFATNITDVSEGLVMNVKQLQDIFNAKIHLVRINTPNNFERDELAEKALEDLAERFMFKDYTVNIYNDVYEDQGILSFAKKINAHMIAMGTHGRTGLKHLLTGSLAEDVVNHAKRPIWTYQITKK
ncbi:MAG: universal stress protein [Cytophagales bacterium]|nr:universal stress protein [Cytophagales bacterium]